MIELRTLGALNLLVDGREVPALIAQPKRLALLCYLALVPAPGFRRRDVIVTLFWPERGTGAARAALRQALHVVRRSLGEDVIAARGSEELGVQRDLVSCDAASFESEVATGRLEEAMAIYRGPLLEGFHLAGAPLFGEWLEETRGRLTALARRAAALLAARAAGDESPDGALLWARRACELDPDDEACFATLLRLLVRAGDRCVALREYERFARRLRREYGIDPSPEIRALVGSLRSAVTLEADRRGDDGLVGAGPYDLRSPAPGGPLLDRHRPRA